MCSATAWAFSCSSPWIRNMDFFLTGTALPDQDSCGDVGWAESVQPDQNVSTNAAWIHNIHILKFLARKLNSWRKDLFAPACQWQLRFHNASLELLCMCAFPLWGSSRCLSIRHGKTPFPNTDCEQWSRRSESCVTAKQPSTRVHVSASLPSSFYSTSMPLNVPVPIPMCGSRIQSLCNFWENTNW